MWTDIKKGRIANCRGNFKNKNLLRIRMNGRRPLRGENTPGTVGKTKKKKEEEEEEKEEEKKTEEEEKKTEEEEEEKKKKKKGNNY